MSAPFSMYNIIAKKRDKGKLTNAEIKWVIDSLVNKEIDLAQMSALLMAIYLNGFSKEETQYLTDAMLYSGSVLDFQAEHFVDKHSTGGVGDKTSFIIAPIACAAGISVPMIAGRGLGHTGGTIDKIEAVKGFKTDIPLKKFEELVLKQGLALIGQTAEIAPADKMTYALRDVTATVESIPLITASIMSKKLAEGAKGIVMDIKTGSGAFMSKKPMAKKLAQSIADTGLRFNKNMLTVITDMSQPLGYAIGNANEIIECVEILKGERKKESEDLLKLSLHLAGAMIYLGGKSKSLKDGILRAEKTIEDGSAFEKFKMMFRSQMEQKNPDLSFLDDANKLQAELKMASHCTEVKALKNGYLKSINCKALGLHVVSLGGGRKVAKDNIDFSVGLNFYKKVGDPIKKGEIIALIYHHAPQQNLANSIARDIAELDLEYSAKKVLTKPKLIQETKVYFAKKKATARKNVR